MDATDCPIREPSPFDAKWFSHKLKGSGLKYEVGVNIKNGKIVWVAGGVPCGEFSDLKLARSRIVHLLEHNERIVADDTYKDPRYFIYPSGYPADSAEIQKKIMSRHETLNSRLKILVFCKQHFDMTLIYITNVSMQ